MLQDPQKRQQYDQFGFDGPMGGFGFFSPGVKIVLIFEMLLGRLEIYPILLLFFPATWRAK